MVEPVVRRFLLLGLFCLLLGGCYQAQLRGPVAGASIEITNLGATDEAIIVTSWDLAYLLGVFGEEGYDALDPFSRLVFLGVFVADKQQFDPGNYHLVTASGGEDLDVDQDLVTDAEGTPVLGQWRAIMSGDHLRTAGPKVSVLTEVVYQLMADRLDNLPPHDLDRWLDLMAQRMVDDVDGSGTVDYTDLLAWSQLFDAGALLVDEQLLGAFADALLQGEEQSVLRMQAEAIAASGTPRSGETVYRFTQPSGNSFTCATCHAIAEPASNGLRRAGHPLVDALRRPHYKNGQLTEFVDAANSCLDEWMNADPWTTSSADYLALQAWLELQAPPDPAPAVAIQVVAPPESLAGGDAAEGRSTFNASCAICHGEDGSGSIQAPAVAGFGLAPQLVADRVRLSGRADSDVYGGLTGGIMPFWGANRLSDAELLDLVAYLSEGSDGGGSGGGGGGGDSGCDADHPRVGQTAILSTRQHEVSGTATIVDNCTIEITDFNYDGRGIVVQVYTGVDGVFRGEGVYPISPDLVGPRYTDATLELTLPAGVTLDDFNSISIWCVAVGISFGDGIFN
jgi:cytochrome c